MFTMKLAIFDIDGTMTDTSLIDANCFAQTVEEIFNISGVNTDWNNYEHVTDSSILREILKKRKHKITEKEFENFESQFCKLLHNAYEMDPSTFMPITGIQEFLSLLRQQGIGIAIATGGLRKSAQLKLKCGCINIDGIPLASANDALKREDIIKKAIALSKTQYKQENFDKIIYFGDGLWDALTTKRLNIPFVGINCQQSAEIAKMLEEEGALQVFSDYRDSATLLQLLSS